MTPQAKLRQRQRRRMYSESVRQNFPRHLLLEDSLSVAIARVLTRYRQERGLTQHEVAYHSGILDKTLSTFETGARTGSITLAQLNQLLTTYEIGFDVFLVDISAEAESV